VTYILEKTDACWDCATPVGQPHSDGCDVARCLITGLQRLGCHADHDHGHQVFTGYWPGEIECVEFGWYSYFDRGWIQCGPDHPEASPDLNRLHSGEAAWDPGAARWRLREAADA
jgi:hypothetical protein